MKHEFNFRKILQWFLYAAAAGFVIAIVLRNIEPFGTQASYRSGESPKISDIGPSTRVLKENVSGELLNKIVDNLTYFSIDTPSNFEKAKVKISFRSDNPEQDLHLGFQDQAIWHYETKMIDANLIDDLFWNNVDFYPTLYQKNATYKSFVDFLENPPKNGRIGTYGIDPNIFSQTRIENYKPSSKETVIDTPLRGRQVIYVYLKDEPFKMKFLKQDLNWYEDPDTVTIKIYKGKDNVLSGTIDDDGVEDSSQKTRAPQELELRNPGAEFPEPGVYKIVIDGSEDTVIKRISTNLHKIVFESPIFLAGIKEVYPEIVDKNKSATLFTESDEIRALTAHPEGFQEIKVSPENATGSAQVLKLDKLNVEATVSASQSAEATGSGYFISVPKNDVILKALLGFFAFSKDQYFEPSPYKHLPINSKDDIEKVDYIVANYTPSRKEGDWQVAEAEFDLKTAVTKKGKLSWLIKAPKLKERGGSILIKKIEATLTKKPLIKLQDFGLRM